jgi:predicted glycosyltransferase
MNKKYLFYLVHPAKFHFHKNQINTLLEKGYQVDIIINTKDILEELVKNEGWHYVNIFPKTRKIKGVHVYLAAFISLFLSIYKLLKYTYNKKYDILVGDALVYIGWLKRIPAFYPTDDVLAAVPEQKVWFIPTKHIIAPVITDVGKYASKKIGYKGYKALAHLHPNHFKPNRDLLIDELKYADKYFMIRCTGFGATHDLNKKGVDDNMLIKIVEILEPHGKIFITSERNLPEQLKKYQYQINKNDVSHYIAFSEMFIGDSTTMCTESAILGVPTVEFDEYFYEIEQMLELENKYQLINCFRTNQIDACLNKIKEMVSNTELKNEQIEKTKALYLDMIDVSSFLTWLFESYPKSFNEYKNNPNIQDKFK